jgi:hypothetical protein
MAANDYHFITRWRFPASAEEIIAIISDASDLPRWWPSVYLEVTTVEPGDASGLGKHVSLYTKGWLPYTLRWGFRVTEVSAHSFTLVAEGDFVGRGIWTFSQDGDQVDIVYDWKIEANKPLLRIFSFALKPLFSMNHHWAMRQGEISLARELARRRGQPAEPPPAGTPTQPLRWLGHVLRHGTA